MIFGVFFLLSAGFGYWSAYNTENAFPKLLLLFLAILFVLLISTLNEKERAIHNTLGIGAIFFSLVFIAVKLQLLSGPILLTANRLAGLSAVLSPFLFSSLLNTQRTLFRIALGLGTLLILTVLVLSGSRGAIASLLIALFIWWVYTKDNSITNKIKIPFIALSVSGLLLVGALCLIFISKIQMTGLNNIPGAASRIELYANSAFLLQDFGLLGGGLNSFGGLYSQYILSVPFLLFTYGHNLYIDLLLEQGVIGLISFLGVFISGFFLLLKHPDINKNIFGACLASIIVLLMHGLIDDAIYGDIGSPLLFAAPAFAFRIPIERIEKMQRTGIYSLFLFLALLIAGFWARPISAAFRSNLASINIAKVQLENWPTGEWSRYENSAALEFSEISLEDLLSKHPGHSPTLYKLGLINLEKKEFSLAVKRLVVAHQNNPQHPGIKKNLGFAYLWNNDIDNAKQILAEVPNAKEELFAYIWWWEGLNEPELSKNAQTLYDSADWGE